jgi:hypothetical protein
MSCMQPALADIARVRQHATGPSLKYSNDEFNATSLYLPDGGTDI